MMPSPRRARRMKRMTTAAAPHPTAAAGSTASDQPADVLVVFGITGDLAKQMTLHSLYRLEARGLLTCPIVGVAVDDWTADDLRERARQAILASGETLDPAVFDRFAARLSYLAGDFSDATTFERLAAHLKDARCPVFYLEIPPFPVRRGGQGAGGRRAHRERARGHREAVRARPRVRPRTRRRAARASRGAPELPDRPLPRQARPDRDPLPALRERDPRAGLAPQPRRERPDHDGGGVRRGGPRAFLRSRRRLARRRRQPPDAGRRRRGDGAPGGPRPGRVEERAVRGLPLDAAGRSRPLRARPVRRLPPDRRRRGELDDRDVRRHAAGDRQLALVGRAVLYPRRQGPAGHPDRAAARVQAAAAARVRRRALARARPAHRATRPRDRHP